jgi:tRNA-specific 2-thiouridylase
MSKPRVCIAMSGGVDSSVAAALLKDEGYDVVGISMRLYNSPYKKGNKGGCCTPRDMDDARRVAEALDIPYYLFDYGREFDERVIQPFVDDYLHGRTPNPCVRCNQDVKFDLLFKEATALGCELLATGHYARKFQRTDGLWSLEQAIDPNKDQSYFLFGVSQHELSRILFPLGGMHKDEVRAIAKAKGLPIFDKPDSQEICFVAGGSYVDVVRKHAGDKNRPGKIVDESGAELGTHDGFFQYTVGQRRGLGSLGAEKKYVLRVLPDEGTVVVGDKVDLVSTEAQIKETRWTIVPKPDQDVFVKLRYRMNPVRARVELHDGARATLRFLEPAPKAAPGQAAVIYDGESALGGGFLV